MNTQLSSWAELRHDFLLYAKQSYTAGIVCSYPKAYIEPIPQFYSNIKNYFIFLKGMLNIPYLAENKTYSDINSLCENWISSMDMLNSISKKILNKEPFNNEDVKFFDNTMTDGKIGDCSGNRGVRFSGWYQNLYYNLSLNDWLLKYSNNEESLEQDKFIVADVHTIPTDEDGNMVGWVLHAGTGKLNLAVVTTPLPSSKNCSYVGPVNSYYEYISNDFKRLTNKDWREIDGNNPVYRPAFTNLYIANNPGKPPIGDVPSLYTYPIDVNEDLIGSNNFELNCKPNPFNNSTVIYFKINNNDAYEKTELKIFDLKGNLVKTIIDSHLPANNYSFLWFGKDNYNNTVPMGTYIYSLKIGERIESGKMSFVK